MKFLNCRFNLICFYKNILLSNKSCRPLSPLSFAISQFSERHYSSSSLVANGNFRTLLNNSGIRSYLDKLISDGYSDAMSKPNVSSLITSIRSLKVDLKSLNEFDTGY